MAFSLFYAGLQKILESSIRGITPFDPSKFRVILLSGGTLNASSTLSGILALEVTGADFGRAAWAPAESAIVTLTKSVAFPTQTLEFTNTGATAKSFEAAVILGDVTTSGGSITAGVPFAFQLNDIDGQGSRIRTVTPDSSYLLSVGFGGYVE